MMSKVLCVVMLGGLWYALWCKCSMVCAMEHEMCNCVIGAMAM